MLQSLSLCVFAAFPTAWVGAVNTATNDTVAEPPPPPPCVGIYQDESAYRDGSGQFIGVDGAACRFGTLSTSNEPDACQDRGAEFRIEFIRTVDDESTLKFGVCKRLCTSDGNCSSFEFARYRQADG